ncbi:cyanophycinase [Agromyces sp. C10]|uniref:cyanophycinase n=1 Tax=Agromyces sp. C10 TaxID=2935077 RepID=UPI00200AB4ED|nr:cyanophycinase [Agromyces sp. C10]MCK8608059.1 cyanophycinase [Agromyces sp. C10]
MRTPRAAATIAVASTILISLLGTAAPAHAAGSSGNLILIGGALNENAQILQRIVADADPDGSGPARARIAIVTAASAPAANATEAADPNASNAAANGLYYADLFQRFGADTYRVPIDVATNYSGDPYVPSNAFSTAVADQVRASTGVFLSGGDQSRYVATLMQCAPASGNAYTSCTDTPVLGAIRSVLNGGGVIAGSSAGLTIQNGAAMVTGGESYEAWRYGAYAGTGVGSKDLTYSPFGGFGFFTEGLLDSHFGTWGRQARMIALADHVGRDLVVGVDETTALVYDRATRQGTVIGANGVSVLDLYGADIVGTRAEGVRWHYLVNGDRIDFGTLAVTAGATKRTGAGTGSGPAVKRDIWDSPSGSGGTSSMVIQAKALVKSSASVAQGTTWERRPTYRTYLDRVSGTRWWSTGGFEGLEVSFIPE